ncbi:MAG: beta-lactamase family protein [Acidobacteriota bacterium]|nr:beta-lactamase family protein [Acidobacteriota bacterium]
MAGIHGWTAAGWGVVDEAFRANFSERHEAGAAFSAYHRGEKVVDLWGGTADESTGAPWEEDTIVLVFSTTKGATALTANLLAQRGLLDVGAPVRDYWPEFATAGKEAVTVEHLLTHRAGLAWVDRLLTVEETLAWEPVVRALEAQAPSWEPGADHGYHATTFGWLVGEVVRRVSGWSLGTTFRTEVADPLGLDFHIGLPESEEPRVARMISILDAIASGRLGSGPVLQGGPAGASAGAVPEEPDGATAGGAGGTPFDDADGAYLAALAERAEEYLAPEGPLFKALNAPTGRAIEDGELLHSREVHAAELPAFNGIGDARSLARMYGACIGEVVTDSGEKVRLLDESQLEAAVRQRTEGPDRVLLGLDIQWGLGFMVNRGIIGAANLGGPRAFGHFGMGGSGAWADPDAELAMAYVMNRMDIGTTGDRRMFSLMQACYDALGA